MKTQFSLEETFNSKFKTGQNYRTRMEKSSEGNYDHSSLYNRDLEDQHPIDAITGLREELDNKIDLISEIKSNTILVATEEGGAKCSSIKVDDIATKEDLLGLNVAKPDWNTVDPEDPSYIKNKPTIVNDKVYVHIQNSASDLWIVNHNLNKMPSITVVDSANTVVTGDIIYIDSNNIEIKFSGAFSGKAFIN